MTLLWLGIISKFIMLSLCATFMFLESLPWILIAKNLIIIGGCLIIFCVRLQICRNWAIAVASLPPKTILSVFLPYSFVLPYKRKTKGRRRGKESDNERCSIEPTQVLGTWGTFIGIIAKGGEWWRRMRFGSRRSFVILQPKQNYPKSVIRVYGRLVNVDMA